MRSLVLFSFVFLLCAYFYNGYGWAQTARYDPIWSFVEPGPDRYTVRIDQFISDARVGLNTGDWALNPEHSEHYYSNKAPGAALLGIPFYFTLYHAERLVGLDPISVSGVLVNSYLINLWVTVLPVALSAVFFLGLARRLTGDDRRALLLTLVLYAGTLMFPFSTMLWGHTTAAAFAVISLVLFAAGGTRRMVLSGLFAGLAVLTDYGAAPVALTLLAATMLSRSRRPNVAPFLLGALGPALVFAAYHWIVFGSPITLASSYSQPSMIGEDRIGGLFGGFDPRAIWGLTFSWSRGLFVYMPVLALSLIAAVRLIRTAGASPSHPSEDRTFAWIAIAVVLSTFLANLSFNGWAGGVSAGPRYQIVALPFYVVLLAFLPRDRWVGMALVALATISMANMFVVASVSPVAPDAFLGSPLLFAYAKVAQTLRLDLGLDPPVPTGGPLSRGSIHVYPPYLMRAWAIDLTSPVMERLAVFNLGERLLGLRGVASLVPALVIPGALGVWMARESRGAGPRSDGDAGHDR